MSIRIHYTITKCPHCDKELKGNRSYKFLQFATCPHCHKPIINPNGKEWEFIKPKERRKISTLFHYDFGESIGDIIFSIFMFLFFISPLITIPLLALILKKYNAFLFMVIALSPLYIFIITAIISSYIEYKSELTQNDIRNSVERTSDPNYVEILKGIYKSEYYPLSEKEKEKLFKNDKTEE